jgi:glycosyltransferase involved in cell wall biosynthesis
MNKLKIILATAYAVNPYKGSEDGMGWNFILQIARFNKVIAITRENNREHIEQYMEQYSNPVYQQITFLYFDLPYWMRFWKKGSRGAMLYFWLWQRAIPAFIKQQNLFFDIVHNVNFHNDWTPSYLWKLKKPFVWGPIGHHPQIPRRFLKIYPIRYLVKDSVTWLIKKLFWNFSPALKNTFKHADHIFCMNTDVGRVVKLQHKCYSIMPSVATEDFGYSGAKSRSKFTLISAGRLVPLKGFDLTILSFADFIQLLPDSEKENCELLIVGSGPEKNFYKDIVRKKGIDFYVRFIEWIDRKDLLNLYQQSSVFIFPSHEGAGMVVAEAMSFGLPVICLENSGPGEFIDQHSGIAVRANERDETIKRLSDAIQLLYKSPDKLNEMSSGARRRFEKFFTWDRRGDQLQEVYQRLSL